MLDQIRSMIRFICDNKQYIANDLWFETHAGLDMMIKKKSILYPPEILEKQVEKIHINVDVEKSELSLLVDNYRKVYYNYQLNGIN